MKTTVTYFLSEKELKLLLYAGLTRRLDIGQEFSFDNFDIDVITKQGAVCHLSVTAGEEG